MPNAIAILLAAGSGSRMEGVVSDKILAPLDHIPVFLYSVKTFSKTKLFKNLIIVFRDEPQKTELQKALKDANLPSTPGIIFCNGGHERSDSVFNALSITKKEDDENPLVFIHDCARPFINEKNILDLFSKLEKSQAASLAKHCKNTIKQAIATPEADFCIKNLDRKDLWEMETPQASDLNTLFYAYKKIADEKTRITDDIEAITRFSPIPIALVENKNPNPKITTPEDLLYAEWLIAQNKKCH